jgi:exopolyphosphatase / guanosine-5'-triphosphate,3'-diphosphate pyrophosphatase
MSRYATIDVGTNTVLLLVAERRGDVFEPLVERAEITRLGRGVDRAGRLQGEAIRTTAEVLGRFAAEARALGAAEIACVATSAARDASNGADFFAAVEQAAGLTPEVIAGDEEARLVWASAWRDFGGGSTPVGQADLRSPRTGPVEGGTRTRGGRLAVIDVGGGSTEVCVGQGPVPAGRQSVQLGAVRLTERVAPPDPPGPAALDELRERAAEGLRGAAALLATGAPSRLVGVAGTVTTLAAVEKALPSYDAGVVHGAELSLDQLERLYARLGALTTAQRERLRGMEPKRADVMVAGCAIVLEAMRLFALDRLIVSDRGVRWGLLYDRFGDRR